MGRPNPVKSGGPWDGIPERKQGNYRARPKWGPKPIGMSQGWGDEFDSSFFNDPGWGSKLGNPKGFFSGRGIGSAIIHKIIRKIIGDPSKRYKKKKPPPVKKKFTVDVK